MALGLTFAIYIGGIDLSAQSMANLITVVASVYLASLGAWVAILCVLVGVRPGGAVGLRHDAASSCLRSSRPLRSGASASRSRNGCRATAALNMDADQRNALFGWMIGKTGIIPNELFIAAALLLICLFIERRTTLGRALKAVGAGELAAAASGLNVARYKIAGLRHLGRPGRCGGLAVLRSSFRAVRRPLPTAFSCPPSSRCWWAERR